MMKEKLRKKKGEHQKRKWQRKPGKEQTKVCFAASSGGHYEQLLMLRPLMERYDSFILTERTYYDSAVPGMKTYYIKQVNRREGFFLWIMLENVFKTLDIFLKEKPDVVISTGVLAVIPMCLLTKLTGRKLVYIESFAKVTTATMTGKLLYKFADQFYVQWESMKRIYPDAICLGGIY